VSTERKDATARRRNDATRFGFDLGKACGESVVRRHWQMSLRFDSLHFSDLRVVASLRLKAPV
jgi:hypothetical protein